MSFSYAPAFVHPLSGVAPPPSLARTGAAPAGPAGKPPAAPATKPVSLSLAQQAAILTNQQIQAQIAAVQQEQHQAQIDAHNRAQQIDDASLAAAHYLSGLGDPAYGAYKDAATSLASLAHGYGGSLKDTAGADAAKVQADLAAAGSPQHALDQGQTLADVAYGRFGAQPAGNLLEQGAAAALRASAVPEHVIGYGQNLAAEALANGAAASAKLAPTIAQIEATRPATVQSLLTQFQTAKTNQEKLAISDALAQSLIGSRTVAGNVAQENAATSRQNADTRQVVANNQASQADVRRAQSDRAYRLQWSKAHGYDPVTGETLPGFTTDPATGKVVKVSTATGVAGGKGALTQNEIIGKVALWHDGKPQNIRTPVYVSGGSGSTTDPAAADKDPTTGKPIPKVGQSGAPLFVTQTGAGGQLTYGQALKRLTSTGIPQAQALQYLNSAYKRGERGRSWVSNKEQAILRAHNLPPKARIVTGKEGVPHGVLTLAQAAALKKVGALPPGREASDGYVIDPGF